MGAIYTYLFVWLFWLIRSMHYLAVDIWGIFCACRVFWLFLFYFIYFLGAWASLNDQRGQSAGVHFHCCYYYDPLFVLANFLVGNLGIWIKTMIWRWRHTAPSKMAVVQVWLRSFFEILFLCLKSNNNDGLLPQHVLCKNTHGRKRITTPSVDSMI